MTDQPKWCGLTPSDEIIAREMIRMGWSVPNLIPLPPATTANTENHEHP